MIIKNGRVFQEDGTFAEKDLYIEGKRFVSTKEEVIDQEVIDAKGMMVLPGLVDVHSHGAAGHDFSDGDVEGLKEILRYEKAHGITSYCPTSMTLPKDDLLKIFGTIEAIKDEPEAEVIAGVNMEGPFIDPIKKGAQAEENIVAPNAEFFRACNAASGGKIRLVTLAPNMPGSLEFIKEVSDEVMVSIGHTTADYDTALAAMKAGAHHVTHLYNAMPPFAHRNPGVIGAAFDDPAGMLVKEAKKFASECTITKDGKTKKLTQLMMLMSLGVKQGDTVTVAANGEDEDAAIETLKAFFEANL